jgi:hypothetical protein
VSRHLAPSGADWRGLRLASVERALPATIETFATNLFHTLDSTLPLVRAILAVRSGLFFPVKVRTYIRAAPAAGLTSKPRFQIRQADVIRPSVAADRRPMRAVIIGAINQESANARGAHFGEGDFLRAFHHEPSRATSPAPSAAPFSIRIIIEWRRPYPAIDASGDAGADRACLTGKPGTGPRLTGRPSIADVRAPLDVLPMLLLYMLAAARLGLGRCDHGNHRQRRRVHDQCQKPYGEFAHAPLRLGQFHAPPRKDAGLEFKVAH